MVRFALITGVRLGNVVGLTWQQVDWDARTFRVKSKKPGGEIRPRSKDRIAATAGVIGI
jgi:integrase